MVSQEVSSSALILKIQQLLPTLSRSEQSVATYIVQHPDEVIYLSVAALAENCSVSDPTVIRTCRTLGFSGYQDLKVTLAQSIATPLMSKREEVLPEDDMQQVINKVFTETTHTLQFTRDTLRWESMQDAANALMQTHRIHIFGLGGSGSVAMDLQHKMMRLGFNAVAYTDPHLQAIAAANCQPGDVVFAISHSGSSRNVVANAKHAKSQGAKIISLTNLGSSPLTKLSDISLFTASDETRYQIVAISSRIAELTIIDSLYTYIAVRSENIKSMRVEKAMENLKY